jgi:hypothetical protein
MNCTECGADLDCGDDEFDIWDCLVCGAVQLCFGCWNKHQEKHK